MKKMTNEEFIEKSIKIHSDKYDYSLVNYINNYTKINIICKEHGVFSQKPNNHLSGSICFKCGLQNRIKNRINNDWLNDFISIHGNRYDYSKVEYIRSSMRVIIICKEHGEFLQTPNTHLRGTGCKKCAVSLVGILNRNNNWLSDFISIHGDRYEYKKVKYTKNNEKVIITCKKHGDFKQSPNTHLRGRGCPNCNTSKGENKIIDFLKNKKVIYIHQHRFDDCKNILPLVFDFYIPNIKLCIEYDGIQHFEPVEKFGGYNSLLKTKENDTIKNEYCEKNNIEILRIAYYDYKNIEYIIESKLNIYIKINN